MWVRTIIFIILVFLYLDTTVVANDTTYAFSVERIISGNTLDLLPYAQAYIDTSDHSDLNDVKAISMEPFQSLPDLKNRRGIMSHYLWLKIALKPDSLFRENELAIYIPGGKLIETYEVQDAIIEYSFGGEEFRKHHSQLEFNKYAIPLKILNTKVRTFYIRINGYSYDKLYVQLTSKDKLKDQQATRLYENRLEFHYWAALSGTLFFVGLFFVFRYIQHREIYSLWYALYLILMAINQLNQLESKSGMQIIWNRLPYGTAINFSFPAIVFICFLFYLKSILDLANKDNTAKIYRWAVYSLYFALAATILLNIFRYTYRLPIGGSLHQLTYIPASIVSTWLAILILKTPGKLFKLIGSGMLLVALASIILSIILVIGIYGHYHLIMEGAILAEVILLTLAMGYKEKMQADELIKTQIQLLTVKNENLEFQQKLNTELTNMVETKSQDIVAKNKIIADQEKAQLEAVFNERIATAELKALKAQLNPHFIFNCLNAIRNLVQNGNIDLATEYLSVFSSFIRKVLQYSEIRLITLEEELQLCELYLRMEQLRFEKGFDFDLIIADDVAADFIKVPPMLLQPLLENAIWHGLLHKANDRKVCLKITSEGDQVICTIEDNGIGRENAKKINGQHNNQKSMGMKLFTDRVELNNQLLDYKLNYEIIDKFEDAKAAGTKINLIFQV